jgi:hypothetical protein
MHPHTKVNVQTTLTYHQGAKAIKPTLVSSGGCNPLRALLDHIKALKANESVQHSSVRISLCARHTTAEHNKISP